MYPELKDGDLAVFYRREKGIVEDVILYENFVLNDFRSDTADSREYGVITADKIKGKLLTEDQKFVRLQV